MVINKKHLLLLLQSHNNNLIGRRSNVSKPLSFNKIYTQKSDLQWHSKLNDLCIKGVTFLYSPCYTGHYSWPRKADWKKVLLFQWEDKLCKLLLSVSYVVQPQTSCSKPLDLLVIFLIKCHTSFTYNRLCQFNSLFSSENFGVNLVFISIVLTSWQ